ncbi:TPA: ABC transporter permease subunit [Escherichia coli]|nr:ABC transporter permease subunit [Escherichia coli]
MTVSSHRLELLSPARDAAIAREAILHGADAVYIGGPGFGARHNASNSLKDIAELVPFAHRYGAKIFVTLNTILHDDELEPAQRLITDLYQTGVDALIVQDMGILELDIPPIELHASTQCDIRTVEKAKFLSDVGFTQIVLARELNLDQIRAIHQATDATIEFFIHGALCVAYSGQCYISHAQTGRSANRGDCSQACRLPYTLKDDQGRVVSYEKHLLSMKDNDQTANLGALIDAGVRSFKIEGRYKDMSYVKNITAHYRQMLDAIIEERGDLARYTSGKMKAFFYIAVMLPMWASYIVKAYAWTLLLAKDGVTQWFLQHLGLEPLLTAFLTLPAVGGNTLSTSGLGRFLVFLYIWLPFMILPVQAALERLPPSLLQASADLGARPRQTFRYVVLPLAIPGIAAGSIFTFSLTLGDFIVPQLVGPPGYFIGNMVYSQQGAIGNMPMAAAFTLVPIVLIALYLAFVKRLGAFDAL